MFDRTGRMSFANFMPRFPSRCTEFLPTTSHKSNIPAPTGFSKSNIPNIPTHSKGRKRKLSDESGSDLPRKSRKLDSNGKFDPCKPKRVHSAHSEQEKKTDLKKKTTPVIPPNGKSLIATRARQIKMIKQKIRLTEEQNIYWRNKSFAIEDKLNKSRSEISAMESKLLDIDIARESLKERLTTAKNDKELFAQTIQDLHRENATLKREIEKIDKQINEKSEQINFVHEGNAPDNLFGEGSLLDVSMVEASSENSTEQAHQALEQTMCELTGILDEIDTLKDKLRETTLAVVSLETKVNEDDVTCLLNGDFAQDDQKDAEGDAQMATVIKLQEAVDKCMTRIKVLTEQNNDLDKAACEERRILGTLDSRRQAQLAESLCMIQYRQLLKKAAQEIRVEDEEMTMAP